MTPRLLSPLKLLIALLSVVVLLLAAGVWQRQNLGSTSRALAVSVTQNVLSSGEASALLEHVHEELLAMRSAESLRSYLYEIPLTLGPLQEINSISGGVAAPLLPGLGEPPSASYQLSLTFSRSDATAFVDMRREDGGWRFTRFRVDAPLLYN